MTDRDRDVRERCAEKWLDLDAIEARFKASTHGVWASQGYTRPEDGVGIISWPQGSVQKGPSNGLVCWASMSSTERDAENASHAEANAEFIAHAHQDVPALIAYIRALDLPLTSADVSDERLYRLFHGNGDNRDVTLMRKLLARLKIRVVEGALTSAREVTDTGETRQAQDPISGETVTIRNDLVRRLRGEYACGPTLPNGDPEFGWRRFGESSAINLEAASEIERLQAALASAPQPACAICRTCLDADDVEALKAIQQPTQAGGVRYSCSSCGAYGPDDAFHANCPRQTCSVRRDSVPALSPAPSPQAGVTISPALLKGLDTFACKAFESCWEGGGLGGDDIQEIGVETGLLTETTYDPVIHGENSDFEPGDRYFIYNDELASLSARREG